MTREAVQDWLDRYVDAWRSYDAEAIGELFAEDATYAYHPYDAEPVKGRAAIVADWRLSEDPAAADAARAVVSGRGWRQGGDLAVVERAVR